jgi:hypothetical protein
MPDEKRPDKGSLTGLGVALMVIGLLILVPSGLCTGLFGLMGLISGDLEALGFAIVYGIVPVLVGAGLVWAGLKLRQRK